MKQARERGDQIDDLNDWNIRWIGPDGYRQPRAIRLAAWRPNSSGSVAPILMITVFAPVSSFTVSRSASN